MKYLEWFENNNMYYKMLYVFYAIISVTCIREIPYITTILSVFMVMLSFIYFCIFLIKGYYFKMSKLRYLLVLFLILQLGTFFVSSNYISDFIRLVFNGIFFFIISMYSTKSDKSFEINEIFKFIIYTIFPIVLCSLITYYFRIKFIINDTIYGRLDDYDAADKVLTGLTVNINTLGILCAFLVIFSIHLLISKNQKISMKIFLTVSIIVGLITLIHTEARGAILTTAVYLFLITIFMIKNKIISLIIVLFTSISGFVVVKRIITVKGFEVFSTGRSLLWLAATKVIKENPLFGVGTTAFVDVVKNSSPVHLPGIEKGGLHNIYIQIATANGCIALTVFIIFILSILIIGLKRVVFTNSRYWNKLNISLLAIIFSFLALNFVESGLMYIMSFIALIFWICIGALISIIELE